MLAQRNLNVDAYFSQVERNAFIPTPPVERIFIGDGNFIGYGISLSKTLINELGLLPNSKVLDVGSGIGRLALPLTQWLNADGRFIGVEIVMDGVAWCRENISSRFPNFKFIHADLQNDYYNATGQGTTANFRLPNDAMHADIAVFASVFTHLVADDSAAWLRHVFEALKPGGFVYSTWFLMDEETIENCKLGKSTIGLGGHVEDGVYWQTPEKELGAVGYAPAKVDELVKAAGFRIKSRALGSWCDRSGPTGGYQDTIILQKPA